MLPIKNRLKKEKDFKRVFKQGKSFKEDFLLLRLAKNDLKVTRFGFVVGLKVSKKASFRNKIKRRLREIVRVKLPKVKTGLDIVLIADKSLADKDFQETETIVDKLFQRAKIKYVWFIY